MPSRSKIIINGIVFNHEEIDRFGFLNRNEHINITVLMSDAYKTSQAKEAATPETTTIELYNDNSLIWSKTGFTDILAGFTFTQSQGFIESITLISDTALL